MLQFDATFILVLLSFIVFMLWMKQVYFEPVAAVKHQRADALALAKTNTQAMLTDSNAALAQLDEQLKQARLKAHELTEAARLQAKQQADERLSKQRYDANTNAEQQLQAIQIHMGAVQSELLLGKDVLTSQVLQKVLPGDVAERWGLSSLVLQGREG
jgi:F0F1-type ATP synthase membrane subunit b/b'